jgi:hypothetical protein
MRDVKGMRDRYLRNNRSIRMGNLASSLLRLSDWVRMKHKDEAIIDLMREIAWFMEWNGDIASTELADMQREVCRWRRVWPVEQAHGVLAFRARQMSDRVLELSGLVEKAIHEENHSIKDETVSNEK